MRSGQLQMGERTLVIDEGGGRALLARDGTAETSPFGASEPLVALGREGEEFAFLGRSGRVFLAEDPLGQFTDVRSPPDAWVQAAGAGGTLWGVSAAGELVSSGDWGRTWDLESRAEFFTGVASLADGTALVLSVPERWHLAGAGERAPRALDLGPVGPQSLRDVSGSIHVETVLGGLSFDGARFVSVEQPLQAITTTLPVHPHVSDVLLGRLAIGTHVVGVAGTKRALRWQLFRMPLGAPTPSLEDGDTFECSRPRVVMAESRFAVLCQVARRGGGEFDLEVLTFEAGQSEPTRQEVPLRADPKHLAVALSEDGLFAFAGVCPRDTLAPSCQSSGAFVWRPGKEPKRIPLPGLGPSLELSIAGDRVLALGSRQKDGRAMLQSAPTDGSPAAMIDLPRTLDLLEVKGAARLAVAGGVVGVLIRQAATHVAAFLPSGELLAHGEVPQGLGIVAGAGRRFLAIDPEESTLFESVDGGVTWARSLLPQRPCSGADARCEPTLACGPAGCLLGDELTRVGWGLGTPKLPSSKTMTQDGRPSSASRFRFRCEAGSYPWQAVPGLRSFPSASDAALGDVDFAQVASDPETGSVAFVHAKPGAKSLERHLGFSPVSGPERYAFYVSQQIEGSAAVRYKIPPDPQSLAPLGDLEVTWDNRISGVIGHGQLKESLTARRSDYDTRKETLSVAQPGLISVAGRGLYLRPHQQRMAGDVTYYFEADRVERLPEFPFPPELGAQDESEYVRVGGEHVPFLMSSREFASVGAGSTPGAEILTARLLALRPADARLAQGVSIAYLGEAIGLVSKFATLHQPAWLASFVTVGGPRGLGVPIRVPLKADLENPAAYCSPEVRKATPRVVAPDFPGPSPEVEFLELGSSATVFQTARAVLHGTPDDACVAAWDAAPSSAPGSSVAPPVRLLILPRKDRIDGWAVRVDVSGDAPRRVLATPIECALLEES